MWFRNASSNDAINTIGFTDGKTVSSKLMLTLEATTGALVNAGKVTLRAGEGVMILNSMSGTTDCSSCVGEGNTVNINADYENGNGSNANILCPCLLLVAAKWLLPYSNHTIESLWRDFHDVSSHVALSNTSTKNADRQRESSLKKMEEQLDKR